jgi:hypothetical protein
MATEKVGTYLDDNQSLKALVEVMPETEKEEYRNFGSLALESVFPNRRMVVYTLRGGEPTDIRMVLFGDLHMDRIKGPTTTITDETGDIEVGPVPTRYRNMDLFFHVPQKFEFKWKGKQVASGGVQFAPHYAILVKTRSREIHQVEGHTYCVTLNKFWERFPHLRNIRY